MPTKIKNNNMRGRPKKEFKMKPKKVDTIKRGRGRPKKNKNVGNHEDINKKIIQHKNDVKNISQTNNIIHAKLNNNSFFKKKIDNEKNGRSDKFALGLLIFSMLLFIFSLYKTFYTGTYNNINNNVLNNNTYFTGGCIAQDIINMTDNNDKNEVNKNEMDTNQTGKTTQIITKEPSTAPNAIKVFYETINNKNFSELPQLVDKYLRHSNTFKAYYTENWLGNFLGSIANEKIYITDFHEIEGKSDKPGVTYYSYSIKYKLKNSNKLSKEKWESAVVTRNGKKLVGSLQCVNDGCSTMPFFNPKKYGIK